MLHKNKKAFKIISMFMLFVMLFIPMTGCMKTTISSNEESENGKKTENNSGEDQSDHEEENIAMGRYVETVTDLSGQLTGYNNRLYQLDDGSLIITDDYSDFLISKDNGVTWEKDVRDWHTKMIENETYVLSMAVGRDNTVAVIYDDQSEAEAEETPAEDYEMNVKLLIIKPDGEEVPVMVSLTEEEKYLYGVYISRDGRIFATTMGSNTIYEIKEDGSGEKFLTPEEWRPDLIQFQGNLMIMDGYDYDSLLIYDMEKEEYLEDEVLAEFIRENYIDRSFNGNSWCDLFFFPGEENVLYLAGEKGLHRHVIGGSAMEQVIDGSLCTFNNPAYGLFGMIMLEDNEFMTLFNQGRLVRFTYDPDTPTVPSERLKVYSLEENSLVRQAITLYQTANPDVFVEYEIGIGEDSSMTREDALKTLNTKIMAGEGPDVLILDDMPVDSYMGKGLLLDLSSVMEGLSGEEELFGNIVDAFRTDDKIYTIPCEIQLPILFGREDYLSQMQDLKGIADGLESLRKAYPNQSLLKVCTEKGIMRLFAISCAPSWRTQEGGIDPEAVAEFLTQTKRIYEAQVEGLSEDVIEKYNNLNEYYLQDLGVTLDDSSYLRIYPDEMGYFAGESQLVYGAMTYPYEYGSILSVGKVEGFEDCKLIPMNGQSSNVFLAETLAGINAASKSVDKAQDFLKVLLGKENQSSTFMGYAVNKAAFEDSFVIKDHVPEEGEPYGYASMGNGDGLYVELAIYWPDQEQIDNLEKWMERVDTPYIEDKTLENAIYEEGTSYFQGEESLEEAVNEIEKKMSLYLAE